MLKALKKRIKSKRGFTLVELLVVVAIIAILAAVLVPRFLTYTDRAREARAMADINAIRTVITAYMADEGNGQPPINSNDPTIPNSIAAVLQSRGIKWTGDASGITDPWGRPYYYEQVMNTIAFKPVNSTLNVFNTYVHEQKFYLTTA
ncbi:type II secretion system protein G [Caldanaerobius fijiensis DSM 17918]|uniref:Type II secretion system protein G n=1 Tax=Caldanaerobius fijiensis DSM 17918 TaxID=1121256 RepID=A0A1M5BL82_9THEO|nr:type II secretion system protein [Caldanaerobius fijiensis]SHF42972.1 type II secretion system protein G [Caldanaerobius fijiensis DSM 17918]